MTRSGFGIRGSGLVAIALSLLVAGCGGSNKTVTTPSSTGTTSETWSGVVAPGGQSSRSFTVNNAGAINVTLTAAGTTFGLGVGVPRVTGGGCRLGVTVNAAASTTPQITTQAEAGQYCVQVYDLGTITGDPVGFALKIDHP